LDPVLPGDGSNRGGKGNKRAGVADGGDGALEHLDPSLGAPSSSTTTRASAVKRKLVVPDLLSASFPPSASSFARLVPGRPRALAIDFEPEWRRLTLLATMHIQQQKQEELKQNQKQQQQDETQPTTEEKQVNGAVEQVTPETNGQPTPGTLSSDTEASLSLPNPPPLSQVRMFGSDLVDSNIAAGPLSSPSVVWALRGLAQYPNRLLRLFPDLDESEREQGSKTGQQSGQHQDQDRTKDSKSTTDVSAQHLRGIALGSKGKTSTLARVFLCESSTNALFRQALEGGAHRIRLFWGGMWRVVHIDDSVPCAPASGSGPATNALPKLLFTHSRDPLEQWPSLLEKALAKLKGSYEDLAWTPPLEIVRMLTGAGAENVLLPMPRTNEETQQQQQQQQMHAQTQSSNGTGAPTHSMELERERDRIWQNLLRAHSKGDIMSATARMAANPPPTHGEHEKHAHARPGTKQSSRHKHASHPPTDTNSQTTSQQLQQQHLQQLGASYIILDVLQLPDQNGGERLLLLRSPDIGGSSAGVSGPNTRMLAHWSRACGWNDSGSASASGSGSAWTSLETQPDGSMVQTQLRLLRRKHLQAMRNEEIEGAAVVLTTSNAATTAAATGTTDPSGTSGMGSSHSDATGSGGSGSVSPICWINYDTFLAHFMLLQFSEILADAFESWTSISGEWGGRSSGGPGFDLASGAPKGYLLYNPVFRLRNTANKKVGPVVLSLCRGSGMMNAASSVAAIAAHYSQQQSSPSPVPAARPASSHHARSSEFSSASVSSTSAASNLRIGLKVVCNQLNHSLNTAAPTSSPLSSQVVVSPLHEEVAATILVSDPVVSVRLESLERYKDYYIVVYNSLAGTAGEGDFVVHLNSNVAAGNGIIFDAPPPAFPLTPMPISPSMPSSSPSSSAAPTSSSGALALAREFPIVWRRVDASAAGSLWLESYLNNPTLRMIHHQKRSIKLLLNLVKTVPYTADHTLSLRVLVNTPPPPLQPCAFGCASAPPKFASASASGSSMGVVSAAGPVGSPSVVGGGARVGRSMQLAPLSPLSSMSTADASSTDNGHGGDGSGSASGAGAGAGAGASGLPPKRKRLPPCFGSLSPFHSEVAGTRFLGNASNFYGSEHAYPVIVEMDPGVEYFVVASTFQAGLESEATLHVYGEGLEQVQIDQVLPRIPDPTSATVVSVPTPIGQAQPPGVFVAGRCMLEGKWSGAQAAGPARRKKTYLNNPQFFVRHQGPSPLATIFTLLLPAPYADVGTNISLLGIPQGQMDPNPWVENMDLAAAAAAAAHAQIQAQQVDTHHNHQQHHQQQDRLRTTQHGRHGTTKGGSGSGSSGSTARSHEKRRSDGVPIPTPGHHVQHSSSLMTPHPPPPTRGATTGTGLGLTSLRIKAKPGEYPSGGGGVSGHGTSNKKKKQRQSNNMFDLQEDGEDPSAASIPSNNTDHPSSSTTSASWSSLPPINPLAGSDFEILSQTSFSGDLYKTSIRVLHLYVLLQPHRSYFIVPSTSVPGIETEFQLWMYGVPSPSSSSSTSATTSSPSINDLSRLVTFRPCLAPYTSSDQLESTPNSSMHTTGNGMAGMLASRRASAMLSIKMKAPNNEATNKNKSNRKKAKKK